MAMGKTISEVARETDLPAKTIRYYEDIGLVIADRSSNGYRSYGQPEIHKLKFVQRARSLGSRSRTAALCSRFMRIRIGRARMSNAWRSTCMKSTSRSVS